MISAVSQEYGQAGTDASGLQTLAALTTEGSDLAFQMAMIVLGAGSLMFCYILYKIKLVPRALAMLGFVGYIALFASGWLTIFGYSGATVLYVPGAIFEIIFPIWLIVKGFNPSTIVSESSQADMNDSDEKSLSKA